MTTPNTPPTTPTNPGGPNQNPIQGQPPLGGWFNAGQVGSTTSNVNTNYLGEGIDAIQPPVLRTFVYTPQIRVVIAHGGAHYDVSADVVRWALIRPENSAASFHMTVQNKGLRYTPADKPRFSRMDRIMVWMKKTGWVQVFSGYLDTIPYRQLYPGTVDFKATCTVKRLMHTWFNPDLPESVALLQQTNTPEVLNPIANAASAADSGLGTLLGRLLIEVGGWRPDNIHIQNFPMGFFNFMRVSLLINQQTSNRSWENFKHLIMGGDTSPGPGSYVGHNPNAGAPGPSTPGIGGLGAGIGGSLTTFYLSQIVTACDEKGLGPIPYDNDVAAGLVQAGTTGEGSQDPADRKAWQQVQQTNLDAQQANRNSDGAILAVAAAMVESGGGAGIRNVYSPAVPGSDQFPNDGPSFGGTGIGILGQPNTAEYGTIAQRMNPKQAAGMFFARLSAISGWRTMQPAEAIMMVQRTNFPDKFVPIVPIAQRMVQEYRKLASVVPVDQIMGIASSVGSGGGGIGGAPGLNSNLVPGQASTSPQSSGSGRASATRAGKPNPDSEGAINWAMTQIGKPYKWGGKGPANYDCSGLVSAAFKSIGIYVPAQTNDMRGAVPTVPNNSVQRGDLVQPNEGHVVLWCGDGTVIEAQQDGVPVMRGPAAWLGPPSSWAWVGRACMNGGPDPSAPFSPPETMGPGAPPSALDQQAGVTGVGSSGGSGEGVARNLFGYFFGNQFASTLASQFGGKKSFIVGIPLIQMVQAIAAAGLRSWSSAPNGDLMFWYPDYWGMDGKPSVLLLEDIELTDVNINFSDDAMTTHVYVSGNMNMNGEQPDPVTGWLNTQGIVTVEDPDRWLFQRLIQIAPTDDETLGGDQLMRRYGIRPMKQVFAMAGQPELEFLLASKIFMEKWAQQYQTTISMTFMPELFPGMRVMLASKNLQVYVTQVVHTGDYENGFMTQATIVAPSTPNWLMNLAGLSRGNQQERTQSMEATR